MATAAPQFSARVARILVVEDEALVAFGLKSTLVSLGYVVPAVVGAGEDALAWAANDTADLVLMDIRLRGKLDGIETAGELRRLYHLPVVYMTAYADDATLKRAITTSPFGFLTKPATLAGIKAALAIALERVELHRQLVAREAAWMASAMHGVGDAVLIVDSEGWITFMNPLAHALTGIEVGATGSRIHARALRFVDSDGVIKFLPEMIVGSQLDAAQTTLLRPDESRKHVLLSASEPPETDHTLVVIRDLLK